MYKLIWTDLTGTRRARCICTPSGDPTTRVAKPCFALPTFADVIVPETKLPVTGEYIVQKPKDIGGVDVQYGSRVVRSYVADIVEEDGTPALVCSRQTLHRAVARFQEETQTYVKLGFEIEFMLLKKDTKEPLDTQAYSTSNALTGSNMTILLEIVDRLKMCHISVLQFHAESAPGQFEIALAPHEALYAVDELTYAREIIVHFALESGYIATFIPKLSKDVAGNGLHCHISMQDKDGTDALANKPFSFDDPGLTSRGECFLGGILHHLPSLLGLTYSTTNSFERVKPGCWVGAYRIWGHQNREAPLRLISSWGNIPARLEIKCMDASANPYVAIAGILYAGLDGILRGHELPPPCQILPSQDEHEFLPRSITEAAHALQENAWLLSSLGEALVTAIIALRMEDDKKWKGTSFSEQVPILLERY